MKACRKCRVKKPLEDFGQSTSQKDGLKRCCKECRNAEERQRRKQNLQKYAQRSLKWQRENPEKMKTIRRHSYLKHAEKRRADAKQYAEVRWESDPAGRRANKRQSYLKNLEKNRTYGRQRGKARRRDNPEHVRRVRNLRMAKKRGVPEHLFESLEAKRAGPCCICGFMPDKQKHAHSVDHNHSSGAFRGILCSRCNTALGLLKEDPQRCEALIEYIRNPPGLDWLRLH